MSWRRLFWIEILGYPIPIIFIILDIRISPQVWEVLSHYFLTYAFCSFLPLFSFWDSSDMYTVSLDGAQ